MQALRPARRIEPRHQALQRRNAVVRQSYPTLTLDSSLHCTACRVQKDVT